MDFYYGSGGSGGGGSDQTIKSSIGSGSGSGSGSRSVFQSDLNLGHRRFSSSSPNAYLTPAFNACVNATSDVDPSLLRYTRSRLRFSSSSSSADSTDSPPFRSTAGAAARRHLLRLRSSSSSSPLSPLENLQREAAVYKTPLKVVDVEEDVLVMDGELVSESGGSNFRGRRNSGEFGSSLNSAADNLGRVVLYKSDVCRTWEEGGACRYGSKCQFAHGKEELRGPRPWKQKSEVAVMEGQSLRSVPTAGSYVHNHKFCRYVPPASPVKFSPITTAPEPVTTTKAALPPPSLPSTFQWPPTDDEARQIAEVLYGPGRQQRLPVFQEICPF